MMGVMAEILTDGFCRLLDQGQVDSWREESLATDNYRGMDYADVVEDLSVEL